MPTKDCLFTLAFIISFICGLLYLASFASDGWMSYTLNTGGSEEAGTFGLWKKCKRNVTAEELITCSHTHLAQGPSFLDVSRTLACFGLVFVVGGFLGYIISDRQKEYDTCIQKMIFRIQEGCYILAAVLGISTSAVYIVKFEEHYEEDLGTNDVHLDAMPIMMMAVSALMWINAIVMYSCRYVPWKDKPNTNEKKQTALDKKSLADMPKGWLSKNGQPTPMEQKEKGMDLTPSQKTHGVTGDVESQVEAVEVKKGWARSIVAPTQVVLAIKRMKKGEKRQGGEKSTVMVQAKEKVTSPDDDQTSNKDLMEIFTVDVDSKDKSRPPALPFQPVALATPRQRADSSSSSAVSSSSGTSVDVGSDLHAAEKQTEKVKEGVSLACPAPMARHFSQGEERLRARVQQSAVVVTDDASMQAAQGRSRPGISRRHATQQGPGLQTAVSNMTMTSTNGNGLNIYSIPADPRTTSVPAPPPTYDDVIGPSGNKYVA